MKKITIEARAPENLDPAKILQAISGLGVVGAIKTTAKEFAEDRTQMLFEWQPHTQTAHDS